MPAARYRGTWEDTPHLNCVTFNADGLFEPGTHKIEFDDEAIGMEVTISGDRSELTALYHHPESPARGFIRTSVAIEWRPCRFGGSRPYFHCPLCNRSTLSLAVMPLGLRCGSCGRITWRSKRQRPIGRRLRAANKAAWEVGCESWTQIPQRPKRMRQKTFERLVGVMAERVDDLVGTVTPGYVRTARLIERHGTRWGK
jgi:hypothetical protein